jgi:hypothetical protein
MLYRASGIPVNTCGWKKLSASELEAKIAEIRRSSWHHHLTPSEWRQLDRMRDRLEMLQKQENGLRRAPEATP